MGSWLVEGQELSTDRVISPKLCFVLFVFCPLHSEWLGEGLFCPAGSQKSLKIS